MLYREFNDNGYPVFGLHGLTAKGGCECLNPKCEALYKHPKISAWQHTPVWEDEQLEIMELTDAFLTGYGVLCKGMLVIDVDARNGGLSAYQKLIKECPEVLEAGMIVETGSGGGSKHLFFKIDADLKLQQHLKEFKGIDFKSSGFVVGAGSKHKSGNYYKCVYGSPDEIEYAPKSLLSMLEIKNEARYTSNYENSSLDVSEADLSEILDFIPNGPDLEYDEWIKIGMAIHETTGGTAFDLWVKWSEKSSKHDDSQMLMKWKSFGKNPSRYTVGTLIHLAKENGYIFKHAIDETDFKSNIEWEKKKPTFDAHNPPHLAGRIAKWINSRSMYPRENLAVAGALMALSSAGGLRYRGVNGIAGNLFCFCVAGSGTGKESILQSYTLLMRKVGIVQAVHGGIKSEQEISRNIIDHQAAFYTIDEFGETLSKIQGARKKSGSSSYLEGIVGALMGIFSKSNGIHLINNDLRKQFRKELQNEISNIEKRIAENEPYANDEMRLNSLRKQFSDLETGIINPFLNILGFTAPTKFNSLLDEDLADSGFMARALIIRELDDNPRYKDDYKELHIDKDEEFIALSQILSNLYYAGTTTSGRVELLGNTIQLPISEKCKALLNQIREEFWEMGEAQKENQGFVAYTRRGAEMVNKLALVLSMGQTEITEEAILWSFEFIKRDMQDKIMLTSANNTHDVAEALLSKIRILIDEKNGITVAVLKNKLKKFKEDAIQNAINHLENKKEIVAREVKPLRGQASIKYFKL